MNWRAKALGDDGCLWSERLPARKEYPAACGTRAAAARNGSREPRPGRGNWAPELRENNAFDRVVGRSTVIREVVERAKLFAQVDDPVLINGETGTGKEIFARAIHDAGPREAGPFVALNCAAYTDELLENELFGHAAGAFTGAQGRKEGLVRLAEGGTLFMDMDEVDSPSAVAQPKLLRFLQDSEYRPLGDGATRRADIRIIAASNADLGARMASGRFRDDLYQRLHVLPLRLPPLRERREDIPLLVEFFLKKCSSRNKETLKGKSPSSDESAQTSDNQTGSEARASSPRLLQFSEEAMRILLAHHWPGNVRELENVIRLALALSRGGPIGARHVEINGGKPDGRRESWKDAKRRAIDEFERWFLPRILAEHGGNITHAAAAAGLNRRALFRLMRRHGMNGQGAGRGTD